VAKNVAGAQGGSAVGRDPDRVERRCGMSGLNDGGPAFPLATSSGSNESVNGMTLRDWFAGQALTYWIKHQMENDCYPKNEPLAERLAYGTADAMLKERENYFSTKIDVTTAKQIE
jgi:hypothetical protein